MAEFGGYQILEELHRGLLGSVLRARLAGEPEDFVIKVFDPAMMGLLEADSATQTFLDRVGMQKLLASRGARHWAPIHELHGTPDGAYYVTDFYPLSAQKLVTDKVTMTPRSLLAVVSGVVKGLLELRARRRRAHGNLKLGNILISGRVTALEDAPVFLTDPATEADKPEHVAADMFALGELIYQLVMHRPYRNEVAEWGSGDVGSSVDEHAADLAHAPGSPHPQGTTPPWPVPASPQWSGLGRSAGRWRDLCNWLLTPTAAGRPEDLGQVVEALRNLMQRREIPVRKLAMMAGIPLVLLVLLGTGAAVLITLNNSARTDLSAITSDWFVPFEQGLRDPARRQAWSADPDLKHVVDELDRADAAGISFDPATGPSLSFTGYRRTREALAAASRIRQQLTPERWRRLADTMALQRQYQSRRWEQPANFLAQLVRDAQPAPSVNPGPGIDRLLAVRARLDAMAPAIEQSWKQLDSDLQAIQSPRDPVLLAFADALRRNAVEPLHLDDDGFDGLEGLQSEGSLAARALAARLAEVVRNGFPEKYGRAQFARDFESLRTLEHPRPEDINEWLGNVDQYALVTLGDDAKPLVELRERMKRLENDVQRQQYPPEQLERFNPVRQQLTGDITAFAQTKFVKKDFDIQGGGALAGRLNEIRTELDAARKEWVKFVDPREWIESLKGPLAADSQRVQDRWTGWTDYLQTQADRLAADRTILVATQKNTEEIKAALIAADQAMPKLPGLSQSFAKVAFDRREHEIDGLTKWAVPSGNALLPVPPAPDAAAAAAERFNAWCANLKELAKSYPITKQILTPADLPELLKWEKKDKDFWNDPAVKSLVQTDLARIKALADVSTAPREKLVQLAATQTGDPAEVTLEAWRRLGREAGLAWPTHFTTLANNELVTELVMHDRMAKLVEPDQLTDGDVVAAIKADLKQEPPKRWRRYVSAATPELLKSESNWLDPAVSLQARFLVTADELQKVDPPARFNLALFSGRKLAGDGSRPSIKKAVDDLTLAASDLRALPGMATLLAQLSRIQQQEPIITILPALSQPGAAASSTLTLPIKGSPYSLRFVRLTPKGMRPFYLCSTEVSIGAFVDLVKANGTWPEANALLYSTSVPPRGLQAWARPRSAAEAIARFDPPTWRLDGGLEIDFDRTLRARFNRFSLNEFYGNNPKYDHPMQQVPAQAALYVANLAGCRLPTTREWMAAYDTEVAAGGATNWSRWNLRDITFQRQLTYTQKSQNEHPDQSADTLMAGIFRPQDPDPSAPRRPDGIDNDDTLFFKPVDEPVGPPSAGASASATPGPIGVPVERPPFLHLVGNVAEFVCDASDAFDAWADKRTHDGIIAFLTKLGDRPISVIGGSALSPPELDVTKPYKVSSVSEPYADVGFRLAFTAPAKDPAERLRWVLDEQQYLQVASAAKLSQ